MKCKRLQPDEDDDDDYILKWTVSGFSVVSCLLIIWGFLLAFPISTKVNRQDIKGHTKIYNKCYGKETPTTRIYFP